MSVFCFLLLFFSFFLSQLRVELLAGSVNEANAESFKCKGVGEPPVSLAVAAHLALQRAVAAAAAAAGKNNRVALNLPATQERVLAALKNKK